MAAVRLAGYGWLHGSIDFDPLFDGKGIRNCGQGNAPYQPQKSKAFPI